jgi:hypothetical protein
MGRIEDVGTWDLGLGVAAMDNSSGDGFLRPLV